MYDSLLLLILMGVGIGFGWLFPRFLKAFKALQTGAVAVLLFAMGISMRGFTDGGAAPGIWLRGGVIGLAAVAGSVLFAHVYRNYLHRGEPL